MGQKGMKWGRDGGDFDHEVQRRGKNRPNHYKVLNLGQRRLVGLTGWVGAGAEKKGRKKRSEWQVVQEEGLTLKRNVFGWREVVPLTGETPTVRERRGK